MLLLIFLFSIHNKLKQIYVFLKRNLSKVPRFVQINTKFHLIINTKHNSLVPLCGCNKSIKTFHSVKKLPYVTAYNPRKFFFHENIVIKELKNHLNSYELVKFKTYHSSTLKPTNYYINRPSRGFLSYSL